MAKMSSDEQHRKETTVLTLDDEVQVELSAHCQIPPHYFDSLLNKTATAPRPTLEIDRWGRRTGPQRSQQK